MALLIDTQIIIWLEEDELKIPAIEKSKLTVGFYVNVVYNTILSESMDEKKVEEKLLLKTAVMNHCLSFSPRYENNLAIYFVPGNLTKV